MKRGVNRVTGWVLVASLVLSGPVLADSQCKNGGRDDGAMWLSIAHPGLGEWKLKGWGGLENAPPKKFWLGFIPFFGWPGYLQVKSAMEAAKCQTHDEIWKWDP